MCGIAGIITRRNNLEESKLRTLASSLAHRGPDDEGINVLHVGRNDALGMVHRRLSIIDLSESAHQPMRDDESGNWITFNGEIYNYLEIKKKLEAEGITFKSESDTEVILKAYGFYGVSCLELFRGMFAFGIWDAKLQKLFLAVDRFGIKPLYYTKGNGEGFVFCSEVKPLCKNNLVDKKVEPAALDSFLAYGSVQAPLTMIKDVFALLPGHYLIYNPQTRAVDVTQYWTLRASSENRYVCPSEKIADVRHQLEESVLAHLTSDVPVGLFLSGGVDSSALAILAHKVLGGKGLQSFSVVFHEKDYSEREYSRRIGEKYCSVHNEIVLSESELCKNLPAILEDMDQPSIDGVNTHIISKQVRDRGIKTVLSGQGGDEVFGGYNTFKRYYRLNKLFAFSTRGMRLGVIAIMKALCNKSIFRSKLTQILQSNAMPFELYSVLRQLYDPSVRKSLLHNIQEEHVSDGLPVATKAWLEKEMMGSDPFSIISMLEMRLYLANTLLRDGDVMSMAHGLEIRVPFLDQELLKCLWDIPDREKLNKKIPKSLLINALSDELPEEIYMRPKMGFTFPWEIWLRNGLRDQIDEIVNSFSEHDGIGFDALTCKRLWHAFLQKSPEVTWSRIWALYVFLSWYRRHIMN